MKVATGGPSSLTKPNRGENAAAPQACGQDAEVYAYIYIYIYIERERDIEREMYMYIHMYRYVCVLCIYV